MLYNYNGIMFNLDDDLLKKYESVFLLPIDDYYISSVFSHPYKGQLLQKAYPSLITEAVENRINEDILVMG